MPGRLQTHVDRPLTNISVAYMQDASEFIADKIFPKIPVAKQSDTYFVYDRGDFLRDEAAERANGTESAGGDYNISEADPYYCRVYAFHKDVTERDRANSDDPLQPDADATDYVSEKLLIRRETIWTEKFFKSGVWGTEIAGVPSGASTNQVVQWNKAGSDPIKDITDQIVAMKAKTGKRPNTIVMAPEVFYALKNHDDILGRIVYTQKGIVTTDLLCELFEVENIYVAWAISNKANKGAAEDTGFIFGKNLLLCYVESKPGIKKASAGYTFTWTGFLGAGVMGNRISRIPMPWLGEGTERIEGEMAFDMKVISKDLGCFFTAIVD